MASIVDGWRPELHPRDEHGRFRNKWKLASAAAALIDGIIASFNPKTFSSDVEARDYLRQKGGHDYGKHLDPAVTDYLSSGWQATNAKMRAGQEGLPEGMAKEFKPSDEDLILSRAVGPEAFGLNAQQLDGVQEWTGRLVADKAPGNASIGTPLRSGPGTINLAILAPKGTNMIIPGNGSPDVVYEPGQPLRITKVTGDAQSGIHVWAVMTPAHNNKGQLVKTRALGRKLTSSERSPADQTNVNLPEAQAVQAQTPAKSVEERVKALEDKLAAGGPAAVPAAPAPVKKAVKRVPKPPVPTDQPPEGEAPNVLPEKTPAGSATVIGLRATALKANPTPEDAARLRDKLDKQSVQTLRDAAKSLEIKKLGTRKQDMVDKIVDHIYGKRTKVPPRPAAEPKKAVKAAAPAKIPEPVKAVETKAPEPVRVPEPAKTAPVLSVPEPRRGATAADKAVSAQLRSGHKILVSKDDKGNWQPARTKTGATVLTVSGTELSGGRRGRLTINGKDGQGNDISVKDVAAHQTFFTPTAKAAKATPPVPTTPEAPKEKLTPTQAGEAFKEAFKGNKSIGFPEPGPRRAEFNRAYLLAARGKFDEARDGLKNDIDVNQTTLDDLRVKRPDDKKAIQDLENDLKIQIRLRTFIDDHSKGKPRLEIAKPEAPSVPPEEDKKSLNALKAYSTNSRVKKSVEADPSPQNMLAGAIEHDQAANYFRTQIRLAKERGDARRKVLDSKGRPSAADLKKNEDETAAAIKGFTTQEEGHRQAAQSLRDRAKDTSVAQSKAAQAKHNAEVAAQRAAHETEKIDATTTRVNKKVEADPTPATMRAGAKEHDQAAKYFREQAKIAGGNGHATPAARAAAVKRDEDRAAAHDRAAALLRKRADETAKPRSTKAIGPRYQDLKRNANGTVEPPSPDKHIDPNAYFDAKRPDYQNKVDAAHGAASRIARLEHVAANTDPDKLETAIARELKPGDNAPDNPLGVGEWNASVDLRGKKITNREELDKAIDELASKHGLKRVGKPGDVVAFDPEKHRGFPDMRRGDKVEIQTSGWTRTKGTDDPRAKDHPVDVLAKASVDEPTPNRPTALKLPAGKPAAKAPDTTEMDAARKLAEQAIQIEELAGKQASHAAMVAKVRAGMKRMRLEPIHAAGEEVKFDPKTHEPLGTIPEGATATVIRPGYVWKRPDGDVLIERPVVQEGTGHAVVPSKSAVRAAEKRAEVPTTPQEQEAAVQAAYAKIAKRPGSSVDIADLRDELDKRGIPRADQPALLDRMNQKDQVILDPQSNQKILTQRDWDAAITIGGQKKHLLTIVPGRKATRNHTISTEGGSPERKVTQYPAEDLQDELERRVKGDKPSKELGRFDDAELHKEIDRRIANDPLVGRTLGTPEKQRARGSVPTRTTRTATELEQAKKSETFPRSLQKKDLQGVLPRDDVHGPTKTNLVGEMAHKVMTAKTDDDARQILDTKSTATLRAIASDRKVKLSAKMTKPQVVDAIMAHRTASAEQAAENARISGAFHKIKNDESKVEIAKVLVDRKFHGVPDKERDAVLKSLKEIVQRDGKDSKAKDLRARAANLLSKERVDRSPRAPLPDLGSAAYAGHRTPAEQALDKLRADRAKLTMKDATQTKADIKDRLDFIGRRAPADMTILDRAAQDLADGKPKLDVVKDLRKAAGSITNPEDRETVRLLATNLASKYQRPVYLDEFNRIDLKRFAKDELNIDLEKHLDPSRSPFGKNPDAPIHQQRPFSSSIHDIIDAFAGGHVSHAKGIQNIHKVITRIENMKRASSQNSMYQRNRDHAVVQNGPALIDDLKALAAKLESTKLPARRRTPSLPPTRLGAVQPVDESKFKEHSVHNLIEHRGEPLPSTFNHRQRRIAGQNAPLRPGLTVEENKALDLWTAGPPLRAIQGPLRAGKNVLGTKDFAKEGRADLGTVDLDDMRSRLDSAIAGSKLKHDATLWRGVLLKTADAKRLIPGAILSDRGYTATAANRQGAQDVINIWQQAGHYKGGKPAMMKILAPKGTHAALGHENLKELVLARDQELRVVRVEPGAVPTYVVEVVASPHDETLVRGTDLLHHFDYEGSKGISMPTGFRSGTPDLALARIQQAQGFNGKPRVMSKEELDREIAGGAKELHRSVGPRGDLPEAKKNAEAFRTGDLYPGTGVYGNGTYTTPEKEVARGYAGGTAMIRMALRRDARVIDYRDLQKLHQKARPSTYELEQKFRDDIAKIDPNNKAALAAIIAERDKVLGRASARNRVLADLGRFAALLGYDAIIAPPGYHAVKGGGAAEYIILNRTAVHVQRAD